MPMMAPVFGALAKSSHARIPGRTWRAPAASGSTFVCTGEAPDSSDKPEASPAENGMGVGSGIERHVTVSARETSRNFEVALSQRKRTPMVCASVVGMAEATTNTALSDHVTAPPAAFLKTKSQKRSTSDVDVPGRIAGTATV